MKNNRLLGLGLAVAVAAAGMAAPLVAQELFDYAALEKIRAEGMTAEKSKVMDTAWWLTDVHGPRLSGSPNFQKAAEWTVAKMEEWGLTGTALEPWPADPTGGNNGIPHGWTNEKFYMHAVAPQAFPIDGTPTAWTSGTEGLVRGEVAMVTETTEADLTAAHPEGSLRGKWIITGEAREVAAFWDPQARRYTTQQLDDMEVPPRTNELGSTPPSARGGQAPGRGGPGRGGAPPFNRNAWLKTQGALGVLTTTTRGHGVYVIGGAARTAEPAALTQVLIGAEDYNRIARLVGRDIPVTIEADIRNRWIPDPPMFNVVGEIRGADRPDEVVMLGAHFDSWHASTGATDNAAGSAVMLEAMRILKASGVRLRRTVRIGLWNGEEQGLIGSRLYVGQHFGGVRGPGPAPPAGQQARLTPIKPAHAKFQAYFNVDNGTGAIRGVYLERNTQVAPIFRQWMDPLRDLGATHLSIGPTPGSTDHQSFNTAGLPGFQFIQDPLEYSTLTHHTNLDSYDQLQPEDMRRNATIVATFAYLAANRPELLPRRPAPPAGR